MGLKKDFAIMAFFGVFDNPSGGIKKKGVGCSKRLIMAQRNGIRFSKYWKAAWIVFADGSQGPLCYSFSETMNMINEYYAQQYISDDEYVAMKFSVHFSKNVFRFRISDVVIAEARFYIFRFAVN
jgi:hypothetical protein